jgi:hypothetical protein
MRHFLFLTLIAGCQLHEAPTVNRAQLGQWIDDAIVETLEHTRKGNTLAASEAWRSAQLHLETELEPALRYYKVEPNELTELEYVFGRIHDQVIEKNQTKTGLFVGIFQEKLNELIVHIPLQPEPALTH